MSLGETAIVTGTGCEPISRAPRRLLVAPISRAPRQLLVAEHWARELQRCKRNDGFGSLGSPVGGRPAARTSQQLPERETTQFALISAIAPTPWGSQEGRAVQSQHGKQPRAQRDEAGAISPATTIRSRLRFYPSIAAW